MDKKTDAWMPLWIGAYLADTQHLTRDEHGAYLLLMMAYWRNQGPLLDDDKRLASIVKASAQEWKRIRPVLAEFFSIEDGRWSQKRIEAELESAGSRKANASSKAKAAAQARWEHKKKSASSNAPSIPQAMLEDMHEECPTPTPLKDKTLNPLNPPPGDSCVSKPKPPTESAEFVKAWGLYPKREGGNSRKAALKAWNARIAQGAESSEMLLGVIRYAEYCRLKGWIGSAFVKQAAAFFGPDDHYSQDWQIGTAPGQGRVELGAGRYRESGRTYSQEGRKEVVL